MAINVRQSRHGRCSGEPPQRRSKPPRRGDPQNSRLTDSWLIRVVASGLFVPGLFVPGLFVPRLFVPGLFVRTICAGYLWRGAGYLWRGAGYLWRGAGYLWRGVRDTATLSRPTDRLEHLK
jgi:hypothetical protein